MTQAYVSYTLEQLKAVLEIPSPTGFTGGVADYLLGELMKLGYRPQKTAKGGVLVDLGGADREEGALLLSCHADTLGAMVAEIKPDGRLRVSPLGGLNANNIETENVTVHTRAGGVYTGTFQLEDASVHVNGKYTETQRSFDTIEVVIDEKAASKEAVLALGIAVGDIVCPEPRFRVTPSGFIKSRFLDDKLSCAILLAFARYLREEQAAPRRRTYIHFTVYEEVGHGGAAPIPEGVAEALAVDMGCVGKGLGCDETMVSICVKDSRGPSSYDMVTRLLELARERNIPHAADVYPRYGSDADVMTGVADVRHCVIGAGVYASHGYERSHVEGVRAAFDLIAAYTLE